MFDAMVPETQLTRSLSAGCGLNDLDADDGAPIEGIAIRRVKGPTVAQRKEQGKRMLAKVISAIYVPRENASASSSADIPLTQGITTRSIINVLSSLLDVSYFQTMKAAPSGFTPTCVHKLFEDYHTELSVGTAYANKRYVYVGNRRDKRVQAACVYGGRVASTDDDFDALFRVLDQDLPIEALCADLQTIKSARYASSSRTRCPYARPMKDKIASVISSDIESVFSATSFNAPEPVREARQTQPVPRSDTASSDEILQHERQTIFEEQIKLIKLGRLPEHEKELFWTVKHGANQKLTQILHKRSKRTELQKGWVLTDEDLTLLAAMNLGDENCAQEEDVLGGECGVNAIDDDDDFQSVDFEDQDPSEHFEHTQGEENDIERLSVRQKTELANRTRMPLQHMSPNTH